jgi:hypothetical protein
MATTTKPAFDSSKGETAQAVLRKGSGVAIIKPSTALSHQHLVVLAQLMGWHAAVEAIRASRPARIVSIKERLK